KPFSVYWLYNVSSSPIPEVPPRIPNPSSPSENPESLKSLRESRIPEVPPRIPSRMSLVASSRRVTSCVKPMKLLVTQLRPGSAQVKVLADTNKVKVGDNLMMKYTEDMDEYYFTTMNDLPSPEGPWQERYNKLNKQYNIILLSGYAFLSISLFIAYNSGIKFTVPIPKDPISREEANALWGGTYKKENDMLLKTGKA
ncbi:unnamed protein product, partial [Cyprideis torosa]